MRSELVSGLLLYHCSSDSERSLRMFMPRTVPDNHAMEPWRSLRVGPACGADDTDVGGLWGARSLCPGELYPCSKPSLMLSMPRAARLCRKGIEPVPFQYTLPEGSSRSVSSCFTISLTGLRWREQTRLGDERRLKRHTPELIPAGWKRRKPARGITGIEHLREDSVASYWTRPLGKAD